MSLPVQFSNDPLNHNILVKKQELKDLNSHCDSGKNGSSAGLPPTHVSQLTTIERLIKIRTGFSSSFIGEVIDDQNGDSQTRNQGQEGSGWGRAILYPELPWGAPPGWEQGHSQGQSFLIVWDCLIFLCCLYVAGAVPFELGILDSIRRHVHARTFPNTTP
jgi:hypothetical protein